MNKKDLIRAVADDAAVTGKVAKRVVDSVFETIAHQVAIGEKVKIIGFGSFEGRHRKGRTGRNPKTGEEVQIPARNTAHFSAGKDFRQRIESAL